VFAPDPLQFSKFSSIVALERKYHTQKDTVNCP